MFYAYVLFFIAILACGIIDYKIFRIPNIVTFPLIGTGICLQIAGGNYVELTYGFLVSAGIGLVAVLLGGMGGGDLKMMAAIGIWLGPETAIEIIFVAAILGSIWGLAKMLRAGVLKEHLSNFLKGVILFPTLGFAGLFKPIEGGDMQKIPYVVPFGTCLSIALVLDLLRLGGEIFIA